MTDILTKLERLNQTAKVVESTVQAMVAMKRALEKANREVQILSQRLDHMEGKLRESGIVETH